MSDQRKMRAELRQGLHQFLMGLYVSYTETMGQDEAKKLVLEVIEEQYNYFSPDTIQESSTKDTLASKIKELTDKMEECSDYDQQIYIAEKVDVLEGALEALQFEIS